MEQIRPSLYTPPVGCLDWISPHCITGIFVVLLGLWWAGNVWSNFYESHSSNHPFSSRMFYLGPIRALPIESWGFVLITGLQVFGILIFGVLQSEVAAIRHLCVYLTFTLLGVVELLLYRKVVLPQNIDAAIFVLAFYLKAFLTYHHLMDLPPLIRQGHLHIVLNECAIILATLLECFFRNSVVCALVRPYLFLVEGTWLVQVAFIEAACSYTTWDFHDPQVVMNQTMSFTWHCMGHCCVMFFIGWAVWRSKRCDHTKLGYGKLAPDVV